MTNFNMVFHKETPGKFVYACQRDDGQHDYNGPIGGLYVNKKVFEGRKPPEMINVTIRELMP